MTQPTVLVTGANGFVGSSILSALVQSGQPAVGLVRAGRAARMVGGAPCRPLDAWTEADLARCLSGVEAVVHAASVVHRPGATLEEYARFNRDGTRALINACRASGVRRLVFLSSIKVHGDNPRSGIIDETTPVEPEGGYAASKLEAENLVLAASEHGGPSGTVLRLAPVFGRGDKGNVRLLIRAIANRRFAIPGSGTTRKSLVHASTVAAVASAAASRDVVGVYVVADRVAPSIRELADTIAKALGRRSPRAIPDALLFAAAGAIEAGARLVGRTSPVTRALIRKSMTSSVCSPARIEASLGIRCQVDLAAAIADEVAWLKEQGLLR